MRSYDDLYFKKVDELPLFPGCEKFVDKEKRARCFQTNLAKKIAGLLKDCHIVVSKSVNDTIYVDLLVDKRGKISFLKTRLSPLVQELIPGIDSIIREGIGGLPSISPALKRGIPVDCRFVLPVIIKENK